MSLLNKWAESIGIRRRDKKIASRRKPFFRDFPLSPGRKFPAELLSAFNEIAIGKIFFFPFSISIRIINKV